MSADAVVIRPAKPADVRALGPLGALLVRAHHEFDPERFIAATPRTARGYGSYLVSQLGEPGVLVLVAVLEDQVIGYTYAAVEGHDWMALRGPAGVLYDIVVDPAHRGRGVGRLLLEATVTELEARGVPRIVLSTAERNGDAQRLFEHAGFRRTMIEMTREAAGGEGVEPGQGRAPGP